MTPETILVISVVTTVLTLGSLLTKGYFPQIVGVIVTMILAIGSIIVGGWAALGLMIMAMVTLISTTISLIIFAVVSMFASRR
jgi:hypothetical protein